MTVVQNTATDPGGNPLAQTPVRITLITGPASNTPGYTAAGDITGTLSLTTDLTGHWSATLTPNAQITPANSYYQVVEGQAVSAIVVPASGGPYQLGAILAAPPPTPAAPGITGVQVAAGGAIAGTRPEINLIAGSGVTIGAADNPAAARVDVTLTATGSGAGALLAANNLSDLANASASRASLGLGTGATANIGSGAGSVAAGNDSRITGALQATSNLSDLASASAARAGLGLGNAATRNTGAAPGTVAAGDDIRFTQAPSRQIPIQANGLPSTLAAPVGTWTPTYLAASDTGGVWSGWVNISDGAQNDSISFDLACAAGTYTLELLHLPYTNRGIYTAQIDGVTVGTIDGYAASLTAGRSLLPGVAIAAGAHTLTLLMAAKNASASGYLGMIERIVLTRTA